MQTYPEADQIKQIIDGAQRIIIMQADNPDGDSMGSALALEQIIGDMAKEPILYCGVDIPQYLTYLGGWDRISKDLPGKFDAAIIVDTSTETLFENLSKTGQRAWVAARPVIVIDHHDVDATIPYAKVTCNKHAVAAGEVIYELVQQLGWPLNLAAKNMLATAIMADSLGLTTDATTARSIAIISELVAGGVKIPMLEQARRELMRKSPEVTKYKGELLQRIEYFADNRVATVTIPWPEIETYSPQYNPSMLVIDDMRMTIGVQVAVSFKVYNDGHITGKIRANYGAPIANELAAHFGGGGHSYASGFKLMEKRSIADVKSECVRIAAELLDKLATSSQN